MREQASLVVAVAGEKLPADGDLLAVMDVGADSLLALVALAELVEEHAVLLGPRLRLEDGVDAPVPGVGDGRPRHGVAAPHQRPRIVLVLHVLLALHVQLPRDGAAHGRAPGRRRRRRRHRRRQLHSVQLPPVVRHLELDAVNVDHGVSSLLLGGGSTNSNCDCKRLRYMATSGIQGIN